MISNEVISITETPLNRIIAPELEQAIYAGVALSLLLYLRETGSVAVKRLFQFRSKEIYISQLHLA